MDVNYDIIYANLLDKIHDRLRRTPKRSLDDIIADYVSETGITIQSSRLKTDVLRKIASDSSCSQCGVQGDLFKVGDDDFCEGCDTSNGGDITVNPAPARAVDMASTEIFLSKFASSLEDTMRIITERLKVIADDFEGTTLERNMDRLVNAFRRILSGGDRSFGGFGHRGTDAVPAIIESAFRTYNLSRTVRNAVVTDTAIREAIYDFIGEPEQLGEESGGIDDIGRGHIVDRPDNNDGGIFNALTTVGL